jgi:hypothetical protein
VKRQASLRVLAYLFLVRHDNGVNLLSIPLAWNAYESRKRRRRLHGDFASSLLVANNDVGAAEIYTILLLAPIPESPALTYSTCPPL